MHKKIRFLIHTCLVSLLGGTGLAAQNGGWDVRLEEGALEVSGHSIHQPEATLELTDLALHAYVEVEGERYLLDSREYPAESLKAEHPGQTRIRREARVGAATLELVESIQLDDRLPVFTYGVTVRQLDGPEVTLLKANKFREGVANHTHIGGGALRMDLAGVLGDRHLVRWNQFGAHRWQVFQTGVDRFMWALPFYDRKMKVHSLERDEPDLGVFLPATPRTPDIHSRWTVQAGELRLGLIDAAGEQLPMQLQPGQARQFVVGFALFSGDVPAWEGRDLLGALSAEAGADILKADQFLSARSRAVVPPSPPEILSPPAHATVSPAASFFDWRGVKGARTYELEYSQDADFGQAVRREELVPPAEEQRVWFVPQEDLAEGSWYWRVRATDEFGHTGDWTPAIPFEIAAWDEPARQPQRRISSEEPLFWFEAWNNRDRDERQLDDVRPFWENIPEDLRPFAAISTPLKRENRTPSEFFASAVGKEIPFLWRTHGPGRQWDYNSLYEAERIFQEYPNVLGIVVGEKFWPWSYRPDLEQGGFIEPDIATYTRRMIELCRQYGKYYIWGDGNGEFFKWQMLANEPEWMEFFKENSDVVILGGKTNITAGYHTSMGQTLGFWLSGYSGHLAVYAEAWYWDHAGFGRPDEYRGYLQGNFHQMPPIFWALMWLPGMAQGASVFGLEGQWASTLHEYDPEDPFRAYYDGYWSEMQKDDFTAIWDLSGRPTPVLEDVVLPFIRAVIRLGMIPTKEEVIEHLQLAVVLESDNPFFNFTPRQLRHRRTLGPFDALLRGTYGVSEPGGAGFELIPNDGRYGFIPFFMEGQAFELPDSVRIESLADLETPVQVEHVLRDIPTLQQSRGGEAWQMKLGDKLFVANSHENRTITQSFRSVLDWMPVEAIEGELPLHGFLLAKAAADEIRFFGNYAAGETYHLRLQADEAPEIVWTGEGSIESSWNETVRTLSLEIQPDANGWVEFSIRR